MSTERVLVRSLSAEIGEKRQSPHECMILRILHYSRTGRASVARRVGSSPSPPPHRQSRLASRGGVSSTSLYLSHAFSNACIGTHSCTGPSLLVCVRSLTDNLTYSGSPSHLNLLFIRTYVFCLVGAYLLTAFQLQLYLSCTKNYELLSRRP